MTKRGVDPIKDQAVTLIGQGAVDVLYNAGLCVAKPYALVMTLSLDASEMNEQLKQVAERVEAVAEAYRKAIGT
jgi:thiazole synthase ThiGH ThiG subunit